MSKQFKQYFILSISIILFSISVYLRVKFSSWVSVDMEYFLFRWYDRLDQHGILIQLGRKISNYTPPYMYFLALATLTSSFISKVIAIKLISIIFDIYSAFIIYRIVRLRYPDDVIPYLAGAVYFSMPTILINSSIWGQADSIYTSFLLTCIYFLLKDMPLKAILFFSLSIAFKQQAIFLAPFLLILTLQKKIPWYYFILVPLIYIILVAPSVYFGRRWYDVLTIYFSQASSGAALSKNAANLYIFISRDFYSFLIKPSLVAGSLLILIWVTLTWRFLKKIDQRVLILLALISVGLTPFVLPKMHDRYFYPADAISIVLGFWIPELWFIPICYQLISSLSYLPFLTNQSITYVEIGAIINLITLIWLIWKQATWIKSQ